MEEIEIWKPVKGFEDKYKVSNMGYMMVLKTGRIRGIGNPRPNNYCAVTLHSYGQIIQKGTHVLVAEHFIPNPNGYTIVNHKDGDKHNNRASNLEWCTPSDNMRHRWKHIMYKRYADVQILCSHRFTVYELKDKSYRHTLELVKCYECGVVIHVKCGEMSVTTDYIGGKHYADTALYHNFSLPIESTAKELAEKSEHISPRAEQQLKFKL